ncbi:MAG TPA: glycosyltransferase family 87 protein, partial [Candidatus Limnocylindrales bacterium]|nr:glycosyltransferase family 87 protein [Candidatus Limnocylindrales bacterium]
MSASDRKVIGGLPLLTLLQRRRRMIDTTLRIAFVVVLVIFTILRPVPMGDGHAYWAVDITNPYSRPVATVDAFTYSPPAALFFSVLGHLPFEVFEAIWTLAIGFALLWLTGPWALAFLVLPVVASDLYLGNIHVLLAAAIVGSLRRPALWAIPLLTKPSVGVGLLWFLVRREWSRLIVALGVTAAVAALAYVIAPSLWPAWITYLLDTGVSPNTGGAYVVPVPLLIRLPAAVLLVIWGARTNRPWTLPTASMLALPVLWMVGLAMLAGAFAVSAWGPLRDAGRRWIARPTW